MNRVLKMIEFDEDAKTVSARFLYRMTQLSNLNWTRWIKKNASLEWKLIERKSKHGRYFHDYRISVDTAIELIEKSRTIDFGIRSEMLLALSEALK